MGAGYADPDFPTAHYKGVAKDLWARAGVGPQDIVGRVRREAGYE